MHTAETNSEDEMATEKLRYKSPGTDQILAETIQAAGYKLCSEIHKIINSLCNKKELPQQWKECIIVHILHIYEEGDTDSPVKASSIYVRDYRGTSVRTSTK